MRKSNFMLACLLGLFVSSVFASQPVELQLADLQGKEHKLSDYRGQWVVVNYWATWCPPCVEEMPELVFFHDQNQDKGMMVIGVNYEDASVDKVQAFLDEHLVGYPVWLADPDGPSPLGRIKGLPTTFIVSPRGEVVHRKVGRVDLEYLQRVIAAAKAGK